MKVCLEPGCPRIQRESRCLDHRRQVEQARGTRQERGYGAEHDRLRAEYDRRMANGERFICWRCAERGRPHEVDPMYYDLGHDDLDRSRYRGPECVAGNRATSGRH